MNIIVIGLGSMGRRRIGLIRRFNPDYNIVGVDYNFERCQKVEKDFSIRTSLNLHEELESQQYECAFITTSPLSHADIISDCLKKGIHIFTELNLVAKGYTENIKLAQMQKKILFLSSTFLYREEINFIKQKVQENKKVLSYSYHSGQYLPDWHPWEDYRDFFIGKKETNGCREIFAIELPWLCDVFGKIKHIKMIKTTQTELDISFEDSYKMILEHENGHVGTLNVDVVSPKAARNLEIWGEKFYISWAGRPDSLEVYENENKIMKQVQLYETIQHLEGYSDNIVENAYFNEVKDFFSSVQAKTVAKYSFEKDKEILRIIDRIENNEEF